MNRLTVGLAAATLLWPTIASAHMTSECMDQMRRMNTWMAPKKADAERLGTTGQQLTDMVPVDVRMALAKGEDVPSGWSPELDQVARVLDSFGSAASNYLLSDEMFTRELGKLLTCVAKRH